MSKVTKVMDAAGKGLQAAGGEVSVARAGSALLHAGASMFGFEDKTKELLDRSSRPKITLTDADLADLNDMKNEMKL